LTDSAKYLNGRKVALVVAHPGHELRVHRWLELTGPTVFVLTDGSGRTGQSRLPSTSRVLLSTGARPGRIYGRFTDAELYATIRGGEVTPLLRVVREMADTLQEVGADAVVGDALEGFSPSHDLCRLLTNAAVSLILKETGRELENFDFLLDGSPEICTPHLREAALRIELDEAALRRKLAAADRYPELRAEARLALERFGPQAFLTEYLRPVVDRRQGLDRMEVEPPLYERFGEKRVRAGHYDAVIRYRAHLRPLIGVLWRHAGLEAGPTESAASALRGRPKVSSHLTDS
jgi:hypothetical protein